MPHMTAYASYYSYAIKDKNTNIYIRFQRETPSSAHRRDLLGDEGCAA